MSGTKTLKLVLGVVLLLILGILMIVVIGKGDLAGLAAEVVATSAPSPTPTLSLTWENATLDQIHFGEPKVVLTDTLGLRIVGWISDAELLIRRDTVPGGNGSAIEVFNVETQEVRRLAEGRIWGRPIWSSQEEAIAYLLYDEDRKMTSLVWQTPDGQPARVLEGAVQPIVLSPDGRGAMAYSTATEDLRGKRFALQAGEDIRVDFARFAPPARNLGCGWKYDTAVSPDGRWQVVYNCEHFLLVNSQSGTIKEIDLGDWVTDGALPRWALEAQWSPDGQMLAVVATVDRLPNQIRFLLLLDPWKNELRTVPLPYGFPIELSWAPNSRLLLVQGEVGTVPPGVRLPGAMLIDVGTSEHREVKLYPEGVLGGNIAWSPDGFLLAFLCRHFEEGHWGNIAICLSSVEVEK